MKQQHYFFLSSLLLYILVACENNHAVTEQEKPSPTVVPVPESTTPIDNNKTTDDWQSSAEAFVGKGQVLLKDVEGDLNNDGIPDKVIVLDNPASKAKPDDLSPPRSLLILQGNPQGQYRLWASSDKVVLCAQCGGVTGDPFRTLQIEQEAIVLKQDGGSRERWERNSSIALHPASEEWMVVKDQMKVVDTYDASNNSEQNMLEQDQLSLEQYDVYAQQ